MFRIISNTLFVCLLTLTTSFCKAEKPEPKDFYTHPAWAKNANIYEVNIRQYTPEGTFKAFSTHLKRLRDMGVDILWLMPINPIGQKERKGKLGSYYSVKDFRGVNPEFGTMEDFKNLVKKAHSMGFKVILDWVPDHSSWDNDLIKLHPDWYKKDSTGKIIPPVADWKDVAGFNYKNKGLWTYQIESMKFWIKEADVDGFRCDVAMMVQVEFWKATRLALDSVKKVFMLAEAEGPEYHRNGFDMTYGWELHHIMNEIAKGKMGMQDLLKYLRKNDSLYRKDDYRMYFTTNHDENSWNGSEMERMKEALCPMLALCFTLPGMPLIYSGQETPMFKRLRFFDKDTIFWEGHHFDTFFKKMLVLKESNPALWNGAEGGTMRIVNLGNPNLLLFIREKGEHQVVALLNFSGKVQVLNPTKEMLQSANLKGSFTDVMEGTPFTFDSTPGEPSNFDAWGYKVWAK